ncbi:MAG TPA: formate dehydrogenase subunit gamma [Planctomycetota bacterium]|nr:formate dehydrogenase subunit gamma [Planctomycetota bacterium]
MNSVDTSTHADAAVAAGRSSEDIVVGQEIVRHRFASRVIHWANALFFFICLFTGMPIWSPIFGWMAAFFGGLAVCRWLHPLAGLAFFAASLVMLMHWMRDMLLERSERGWFGPKMLSYMRYQGDDPDVGKYNGGQKLFFWAISLASLGLLISGVVMWFPEKFPAGVREASILLHDLTFILFAIAIVGHIYLGTAAEPGTFHSMTRGTVSKPWARLHHPRWYREVTGEQPRRP